MPIETKIIEQPTIPRYILYRLTKIGEVVRYNYTTYLSDGINIYITRRGYAVLQYCEYYQNVRGVTVRNVMFVRSAWRLSSEELVQVLEFFSRDFFDEAERDCVCAMRRLALAIVREEPFNYEYTHDNVKIMMRTLF